MFLFYDFFIFTFSINSPWVLKDSTTDLIWVTNKTNPITFKNPLKSYSGDSVDRRLVLTYFAGVYERGPLYLTNFFLSSI